MGLEDVGDVTELAGDLLDGGLPLAVLRVPHRGAIALSQQVPDGCLRHLVVFVSADIEDDVERLDAGEAVQRLQVVGVDGVHLGLEVADGGTDLGGAEGTRRSEEHTSELQSLMRISYAVFCLNKKK